jgi:hypothetical protein
MWVIVLSTLCGCQRGAGAASSRTHPLPDSSLAPLASLPLSTRIVLYGAGFRLPAGCTLDCVLAVDAHHGVVSCFDLRDRIDYAAAYSMVISRELEPTESTVQGRKELGGALLYWGLGGPGSAEYCAVVTYPTGSPGTAVNHQFCTRSADADVRARIQQIAGSYEPVPATVEVTECRFDG